MAETQQRVVDLLGDSVEYDLSRSSDATKPRIDVDIHGVTVVVPESTEIHPAELLKENAAWVIEKKQRYDTYREQIPNREYTEGAVFPYLGEECEIIVETRSSSDVDDGTLRLAQHHVEETSIKRALETLYRRKAREMFEKQAEYYAKAMGVEYGQIHIRNQKTKWGSCSTSGTLSLNWRLMMAPQEIVDYIVIHELAHLQEPNHDDSFWSLVAEYDPEYEAHSRWLEEHSTELIFSEDDL
ncbi:M48 family metallopeptidase [Natronomonas sp. F2-12]|jgi:predicted metal-dependent hydrolase|uniref:M48 family metallopeptidase n=1 Tax=Natronomonas aquatica TaxID=2841590 RepID=A0A9R1CVF1_9EURY|nr:SprT family zinc-dependent metalloprotease [Natronomonas aquatica]MCQ4334311.1 M48 family metallopeptidase [Natronomonas aquatica]